MFLSGLVRRETIMKISPFLENLKLSYEWFDYKNKKWIRHLPQHAHLGMILFRYEFFTQKKWWMHEKIPTPEHGQDGAKSFKQCMIKSGFEPLENDNVFPDEFMESTFFRNRYIAPFDDIDHDDVKNDVNDVDDIDIITLCGSTDYPFFEEQIKSGEFVFLTISNDVEPKDRRLYERLCEWQRW
jgi:hypothetical protein